MTTDAGQGLSNEAFPSLEPDANAAQALAEAL